MRRGRRAALSAVLGLAGLGLGSLGTSAQATTPGVDGASCSTWSTPSLDVAPVRVSQPAVGVPYVMVCTDGAGGQTANVVLYSTGTTP